MKLYNDDCFKILETIESGSIDLILVDPPYGTMKNILIEGSGLSGKCDWDTKLPTKEMFGEINRVLRKNGKALIFTQEPYSTELIITKHPNIIFNQRLIWLKDHFANHVLCNKSTLSYYEEMLLFTKDYDELNLHPLREYFKKVLDFINKPKKYIIDKIGQSVDHTFRFNSTQFNICTEKTYNELIEHFNIDQMDGFKSFSELEEINSTFNSTFNLWEGNKYKSNVFQYKKDYDKYHPTQKPLKLLEDLMKTFSNENDSVVDFTMGSGSTGVACVNTNRNFIGIEIDKDYFEIAKKRIEKHTKQERLF